MMTRYEMDGVGMFHLWGLLEECEMDPCDAEEMDYIYRTFEEFLPHPDIAWGKDLQCWFTEKGVSDFKEALDTFRAMVEKYIEDAGLGIMTVRHNLPANSTTVYQDEWQVVICLQQKEDKKNEFISLDAIC